MFACHASTSFLPKKLYPMDRAFLTACGLCLAARTARTFAEPRAPCPARDERTYENDVCSNRSDGRLVTAHIIGDIDHHNAREMRETIDDAVLKAQARALELDFRDVTFMDSSGIGLVMGRYKLMQEVGGSLRVVNIAGHLKKVMMLAGLDRLAVMDKPERRVTAGHIEKTGGDEDESM